MILNLTIAKMFRAHKFSTIIIKEVQNPQIACESHLIVITGEESFSTIKIRYGWDTLIKKLYN